MVEFYVLPVHAAAAIGVTVDQLDLPASGYGIDADALWWDPRFIEVRRERAAVALQLAEHRHDIHPELCHKPRSPDEVEANLKRTRQRRYARKKLKRKAQAKQAPTAISAPAATTTTTPARLSVAAYAIAHGMIPQALRQRLRSVGCRAPYSLADIARVTPLSLPPPSVV